MMKVYSERHPEHDSYKEDTVRNILGIAEQEYQKEFERRDTLDSKATTLLGFSGVIASLVAGAGALALQNSQLDLHGATRASFLTFYLIGVLFFVISALLCLMVFWPRNYEFVRLEELVVEENLKKANAELMVTAAENFRNMKKKDKQINDKKHMFLRCSFFFIGLGLLMVLCEACVVIAAAIG